MKEFKSIPIVMSIEQHIELLNHCIVHVKLIRHRTLTVPELK